MRFGALLAVSVGISMAAGVSRADDQPSPSPSPSPTADEPSDTPAPNPSAGDIEAPPPNDTPATPAPPPPPAKPAQVIDTDAGVSTSASGQRPQTKDQRPLSTSAATVGATHAFVSGTALTLPEGKFEFTTRAAPGFGEDISVSGAIGARTQLDLSIGKTDRHGEITAVGVNFTRQIWKNERYAVAATGSVRGTSRPGPIILTGNPAMAVDNDPHDMGALAAAGGVATACVDKGCRFLANAGAQVASDFHRAGPILSASFEITSPRTNLIGEVVSFDDVHAVIAGVRFHTQTVSFDLGVAMIDDGLPQEYAPMFALSIR